MIVYSVRFTFGDDGTSPRMADICSFCWVGADASVGALADDVGCSDFPPGAFRVQAGVHHLYT